MKPTIRYQKEEEIIVQTVHGPIKGTTRRALESDRPVYSYFGVKFGRSTEGCRRFQTPVDPNPWTDIRDCTNENVPFAQQDREFLQRLRNNTYFKYLIDDDQPLSEDCLTVNVFSPVHPANINQHLPVIVWIHGGGLRISCTTNKMWMMPAFENVVLVTINYRVSVFGFLSTNDETTAANCGLLDQVKALEWVRDNIRNFGGDHNSVTIVGRSSGGFCVSAHLVSPLSRGLFHRGVAMSGSVELPTNFAATTEADTTTLMDALHLKNFNSNEQEITPEILLDKIRELGIAPKACIDKHFLPTPPYKLLDEGKFDKDIPVLIGVVSGEFDFTLSRRRIPGFMKGISLTRDEAKHILLDHLKKYYPEVSKNKEKLNAFCDIYMKDCPNGEYMKGVVDFLADSSFNSKAVKMATKLNDYGSDVYFMELDSRPTFYETSELFTRPYNFGRADHTDDLLFLFGFPFLDTFKKSGIEFTKKEKDLSRKMMKSLANFANTGNPNSAMTSASWEKFPSFVSIKDFEFKSNQDFQQRRMKIWENVPPVFQHISHSE